MIMKADKSHIATSKLERDPGRPVSQETIVLTPAQDLGAPRAGHGCPSSSGQHREIQTLGTI